MSGSFHPTLIAHDILRGIYTHRLLTTTQLHRLYAPSTTLRWTRATLADLDTQDLIAWVRVAGGRERAWYLRRDGVVLTEGADVEVRGYRLDARRAAGPHQAHTLASNEVGTLFVLAARQFGDDCSPQDWRNETAHRIGAGGTGEVLISDAVIDYTVVERGSSTFLCRILEIDRATKPVRSLIRQLEAYARLYAHRPSWRTYPAFPPVVLVLCGQPEAVLQRRIDALDAMLPLSAPLANAPDVVVMATTLEQLRSHGPHAPIFWEPGRDHLVDIRGRTEVRRVPVQS